MNNKVDDLQITRGIAILIVLFGHLSISSTLFDIVFLDFSKPFYWGVELFFVLSGFVVTKSLRQKNFNSFHFVIKRCFRLYPAILFLIVFASLLNALVRNSTYAPPMRDLFSTNSEDFLSQAKAIVLGYQINTQGRVPYQLGQMWSLSIEFQFYAFTAVLISILTLRWRESAYKYMATLVLSIGILYRFEVGLNIFGYRNSYFTYLIAYKFDFMAAGVFLAYMDVRRIESIFLEIPQSKFIPYFVILFVTMVLMIVRHPFTPITKVYDSLDGLGMLCCLFGSFFLIAYASIGGYSKVGAFKLLREPLIRLGDLSFTIYLYHFSAMLLSWVVINEYFPFVFSNAILYGVVQLLITSIILTPIAVWVYEKIELKGMKIGDRILEKFNFGVKV